MIHFHSIILQNLWIKCDLSQTVYLDKSIIFAINLSQNTLASDWTAITEGSGKYASFDMGCDWLEKTYTLPFDEIQI